MPSCMRWSHDNVIMISCISGFHIENDTSSLFDNETKVLKKFTPIDDYDFQGHSRVDALTKETVTEVAGTKDRTVRVSQN